MVAVSVVRLLAKKAFEPRVVVEGVIRVERLKTLRVHVQLRDGLHNIAQLWGEGLFV